jgi:hypothetical protein
MNELNLESVRDKITSRMDALRETCEEEETRGPLSKAILDDLELGLFFMVVCDFLTESPKAEINNVIILDPVEGRVQLALPMQGIFSSYYELYITRLREGGCILPSDAIAVTSPSLRSVPNDRPV